ncbi:hypothetical protein ANN_10580 [Periplaneta americana]|uniref:Uncharacterized protein n=1 Tax=Periplaneta americana TaxID=6978 RepID=A0ABQ8TS77_PERAM|nr:hypothetical protein ANN_10580 [Periplaneta americana]
MGRACSTYGRIRNAYRVLVGRPEGKIPLGRPRRRWEEDIKMDLREVGYDGRDWIDLAQDRDLWRAYVRAAMNLLKAMIRLGISEDETEIDEVVHKRFQVLPQWVEICGGHSCGIVAVTSDLSEASTLPLPSPSSTPRKGYHIYKKGGSFISHCAVSSTQKFLVQQHITTSKHQANKQLNSKQRQLFLTQPTTSNRCCPYMVKAGQALSVVYPKLTHFNAFHRVAEVVRDNFPKVDLLISSVKKYFSKLPRVNVLKEMYPEIPLPPKPILTHG